jgi:hypothetical protein
MDVGRHMYRIGALAMGCLAGAVVVTLGLSGGVAGSSTSVTPAVRGMALASTQRVVLTSLSKSSVCHHKKECAVGDDGMAYQITSARRYTDIIGTSGVAIGFTIYNTSKQGHDFSPLGGGFAAVMTGGGIVDSYDFEGGASGDPRCYASSEIDAQGTDPQSYYVRRGQIYKMPKQMCFQPTAGRKVTSVQLASDDAENPVTIKLTKPV